MDTFSQTSDPVDAPPPEGPSSATRWRFGAGVAVALILGGVVGGAVVARASSSSPNSSPLAAAGDASVCAATDVAAKVLPSVVTISASNGNVGGTGSGEIIRSDGYILTNNHVISVAARGGEVTVLLNDGRAARATITGRDPKADLAVIKIDSRQSLPVIAFASSGQVVVGQPVVALGAPLGLSNTVTAGIVSALDRTIEVPGDEGEPALLVSAIQTDAAINPGNSGGALVNCAGQLVGVPSAGATIPNPGPGGGSSLGNIGLGFAIPVDQAKAISDDIIATGSATHSSFGLSAMTVPPAEAGSSGQPDGRRGGVYVATVTPGGPAAKAGLRAGDVIIAVDGATATGTQDLAAVTLRKKPGEIVRVQYDRDGTSQSTDVTLGTQP